jgi:hypothetical protein
MGSWISYLPACCLVPQPIMLLRALHQEVCISVKGNNVSISIKESNYDLYFRSGMIIHGEKTTVKQQENTSSLKANVWRWKWQKPELSSFVLKWLFACIHKEAQVSVLCNIITQQEADI